MKITLTPGALADTPPRRFCATTSIAGIEVELDIAADAWGRARCVGIRTPVVDQHLSGELLRAVPVARLVRDATASASSWFVPAGPGRRNLASLGQAADAFDLYGERARRPRSGSPITSEHLAHVAETYKDALSAGAPTRAVEIRWHVSKPTAGRWVAAARKRGLLGPAQRGRASV